MDHLWSEWRGKPVGIVTYGGHGGGKCAAHLRDVLGGGLRMKVVGGVEVTLPETFIKGKERVTGGEEWLKAYEEEVREVLGKVVEALGEAK